MLQITDVVKHLIIINVLMFLLATMVLGDNARWLYFHTPFAEGFQPFQIVTHMFMHDPRGLGHLFFNMFGLFILGPMLESYWGPKKFLFYYLASGIGALLFSLGIDAYQIYNGGQVMYGASLGASGAVYGVLLAAFMYFPDRELSLIIPPVTLKLRVLVPLLVGFELLMGMRGAATGIGHFAHVGGALTGFLIIMYWRKVDNRW